MRVRRWWCPAVVALVLAALVHPPAAVAGQSDDLSAPVIGFDASDSTQRRAVPAVVETVDGFPYFGTPRPIPLPGRSVRADASARRSGAVVGRRVNGSITTTYETATPQSVRTVIDAAVAAWDDVLELSPTAPVEVSVRWVDLGPRLLGQAGTEGEYRNAERFPTDRWYPAALANQLANTDVNGPDTPEIMVELNSDLGEDWYIGVEGPPAFGQIDLYSVVLHEIAHGLGFLGSAVGRRNGTVTVDHSSPSIYDDLVRTATGQALIGLESARASEELTSDALRIDLGFGRTLPLHAPSPFVNGSSYSHFSESIDPTDAGAMMTPALKNGETQRRIDSAVLGVLDQLGWTLDLDLLVPTIDEVQVRPGGIELNWSEDWTGIGAFGQTYSLSLTPLASAGETPAAVSREIAPARSSSIAIDGLQNGTSYRVTLSPDRTGVDATDGASTTAVLPPNPNPVRSLGYEPGGPGVLSWKAPISSGEPVTGYEVNYRRAGDRQWRPVPVGGANWPVDLPDGRYWFRVRGVNRIGEGIWTESGLVGVSDSVVRPMPLDGQLARLYRAYFDRPPDEGGLDYWRNVRAASVPLAAVSGEFAASREFVTTYGDLDDDAFLSRLYQNVLGRQPDPSGFEYWRDLLSSGVDRGTVVLWFSESEEFIRTTATTAPQTAREGAVERVYLALVRRAPTPEELNSAGLTKLAEELSASAEFSDLWGGPLDEAILADIAESMGVDAPDLGDTVPDGELIDILVGLTQTPAYIAATGTGV